MENIDINFTRAFKLLISFSWRSIVLSFPMMILITVFSLLIFPASTLTTSPDQMGSSYIGVMFTLWIVTFAAVTICYTFALRWTLRTKFSDFKLIAVKPD